MDRDIIVNRRIRIPESELTFRFSRSGGPGGQNVNKVSTRVEVIFDVAASPSLSDEDRSRVAAYAGARITKEGKLTVASERSRSQWKNREMAIERLVALLRASLAPQKRRIATVPTAGSRSKKLHSKKKQSEKKQRRRGTWDEGNW